MITPYLKNKKKQEPTPDPYDGHIKPFGSENKNKMTFGGKYEFKVNDVPPPGYYSPERAESITKPKPRAAIIKENSFQKSLTTSDYIPGRSSQLVQS